ncbi:cytidine deaminase-like protein [Trametes punicea]|nr:cytidine deaminase-like protein [Trametes punicea]
MDFLRLALEEARKCTPSPTAFCVGCVLTASYPPGSESVILARGFSRELPGNTHAEANALTKAHQLSQQELEALFPMAPRPIDINAVLIHADIYTTMEPCSRCFIGVGEPDDFVKCEGAQKLKDAGVEVIWLSGLEKECLEVARMGRDS